MDRAGSAPREAAAAAEVRLHQQGDQQRTPHQRRPVEKGGTPRGRPGRRPARRRRFRRLWDSLQISVEEQGRSLVIKIDREAVMKIAVISNLFTLRKGVHELNFTVGGVPFREDGLLYQVGCLSLPQTKKTQKLFSCSSI